MGLDYHYDNSPREIQQEVFARQLRQAVRLKKPLTIHTREADDDTERILKAEVPKDHPVHSSTLTVPFMLIFCRYMSIASPTLPNLLDDCWDISPICT